MILSAQSIRKEALILPFYDRTVVNGMSYGLSSCGYDVRVDLGQQLEYDINGIKMSKNSGDPFSWGSFRLVSTLEHIHMPTDVMGVVHDKSSWARQGLTVQNTIIEPGWRGYLTLELVYHGKNELRIQQGDPIAQIVFHRLDHPTERPYSGKYQDQEKGPQEVRFEQDA